MRNSTQVRRIVILNVVAPFATYQLGVSTGLSELQALLLAIVFPVGNALWTAVRQRRIDPLSATSLVAIVIGATVSVLINDPRVLLVKDSMLSGALGLAFIGSLLTSRPLLVSYAAVFTGSDSTR